jgi:hypothetical protein
MPCRHTRLGIDLARALFCTGAAAATPVADNGQAPAAPAARDGRSTEASSAQHTAAGPNGASSAAGADEEDELVAELEKELMASLDLPEVRARIDHEWSALLCLCVEAGRYV